MLLCLRGSASVLVPFPSSLLNKKDKQTKNHLEGEAGDCLRALSNIGCGRRREQNDIYKSQTRTQNASRCYDPVECKLGIG